MTIVCIGWLKLWKLKKNRYIPGLIMDMICKSSHSCATLVGLFLNMCLFSAFGLVFGGRHFGPEFVEFLINFSNSLRNRLAACALDTE